MARRLRYDRAHDYAWLIRRWRSVAARAGLVLRKYGEAAGHDLFYLCPGKLRQDVPAIYLSAGIHGDEPGATEGLLAWAEKNTALLRRINPLLFPCINPWGLVNNCRLDAEGRDLNRSFHDTGVPQIVAHMTLLADQSFDLALMLHEDYDATGVYLYEIPIRKPWWGELMIEAASRHIEPDHRRRIEGRGARHGVLRPRLLDTTKLPGWPEAFVFYFRKTPRVFTVETPSEFHLDERVAAHVALVSQAVSLCCKEFSFPRPPRRA